MNMALIDKYLKDACERCEGYAVGHICEDKQSCKCPVYKLYLEAKGKESVKVVDNSGWGKLPTPPAEMI